MNVHIMFACIYMLVIRVKKYLKFLLVTMLTFYKVDPGISQSSNNNKTKIYMINIFIFISNYFVLEGT